MNFTGLINVNFTLFLQLIIRNIHENIEDWFFILADGIFLQFAITGTTTD